VDSFVRSPSGVRAATGSCARLSLLGRFELAIAGEIVSVPLQGQRLLALLAINDGPLLRGYVAGTLWLDTSEERAHANLRSTIWRVNGCGHRVVEAHGQQLQLAPEVDVDLRAAAGLALRLIDRSAGSDDVGQGPDPLARDVLPDWYEEWILAERERFRQLRLHALESLCERLTAAGDIFGALRAGLAAVAGDPVRESAHRALIRVYLAEGNPGEALRQYRIFKEVVREQLGLEPSSQIEDLVAELTARPGLTATQ
jgi:DNA-binding SARP family transcriptional activator